MTTLSPVTALAAAAAAFGLSACQSAGDVTPASVAALPENQKVNPDCRPGDTPAGTVSGLRCTPGSETAQPPGIDSNVEGASTQGQSIAPPER
jgi:hypothetical protein